MADVPELARKAGVLWVTVPGGRPVVAWPGWFDGRTYLLTGPGEQPLPGLAGAGSCEVMVRSAETGGRLATWRADVAVVEPGSDEWSGAFPALAGKRLNGRPDPATAVVLRLTPTEPLSPAG